MMDECNLEEYHFAHRTFLLVDDHNFSRVSVHRLLKNMGDPVTYNAHNGLEALNILEQHGKKIDCVISDFNMPVMHGLQMLKQIRLGKKGIRSNFPVILLTGYNDIELVQLAIGLDVNAFILKPVKKDTLGPRLLRVFELDKRDYDWIKPECIYEEIDVHSDIAEILASNAHKQLDVVPLVKEIEVKAAPLLHHNVPVYQLTPGMVLFNHIVGTRGQLFLKANTELTERHIDSLKDLLDMGVICEIAMIKNEQSADKVEPAANNPEP